MTGTSSSARTWRPTHGIKFATQAGGLSSSGQDAADKDRQHDEYLTTASDDEAMLELVDRADKDLTTEQTQHGIPDSLASQFDNIDLSSDEDSQAESWTRSFAIPPKVMEDALKAPSDSAQRFWSFRKYVGAEQKAPLVLYCTNLTTAETAATYFLDEPVLGFDLEWEMSNNLASDTNIKRAVSVIQIASESKIAIFHIARFQGTTPDQLLSPSLRKILTNPCILKAGVNVAGDMTRVNKCFNMTMRGLFELSHLYKQIKYGASAPGMVNRGRIRLAVQVEEYLGLPLEKGEERTSTWQDKLPTRKSDYAASDAYAGYQLFRTMDELRKQMTTVPLRPAAYELFEPIPLPDGSSSEDESESEDMDNAEEETAKPRRRRSSASLKDPVKATKLRDSDAGSSEDVVSREPSEEFIKANTWASDYRAALSEQQRKLVGEADLRAYHLWHMQQKDLHTTASIMRAEPLRPSTVARYVCKSVYYYKLPCDADRLEHMTTHLSMYDKKYSKAPVVTQIQSDSRDQL